MQPCAHCGRNVAESVKVCPFCKKNPFPAPKPGAEEESNPKVNYKLRIIPREQIEKNAPEKAAIPESAQAAIQGLTRGAEAARENAVDYFLREGQGLVPELIKALENPLAPGKEHIVKILGRLGGRSAVPALLETLKSADASLRLCAAWSLFRINDFRTLPVFLEQLKDKDPKMRSFAAYAVGAFGDKSMSGDLARLLQDPDAEVRSQAVLALTYLEGKGAGRWVKKALKDPDENVRQIARETLKLTGSKKRTIQIAAASIFLMVLAAAAAYFLTH